MTKADLGTKRRCLTCDGTFFDLNRVRIACPKCAAVYEIVELPRRKPARTIAAPRATEVDREEDLDLPSREEEGDDDAVPPIVDDDGVDDLRGVI